MKEVITVVIVLFLISCSKDKATLSVTDFTKAQTILVEPYKYIPYSMFNLEVKGFTNDTVIIKTEGVYNLKMKLVGKIDTLWYSDYYGEKPIKVTFEPFKASKGELLIEIKL